MRAYLCGLLLCSVIVMGLGSVNESHAFSMKYEKYWYYNHYNWGWGNADSYHHTWDCWWGSDFTPAQRQALIGQWFVFKMADGYVMTYAASTNDGVSGFFEYPPDQVSYPQGYGCSAGHFPCNGYSLAVPPEVSTSGGNYWDKPSTNFVCDAENNESFTVEMIENSYAEINHGGIYSAQSYDKGNVRIILHKTGYTPPPVPYWCYFDLQGVCNFDGQTNKSFQAELFVASAIDNTYPGPWTSKGIFLHGISGAYLDSVYYKLGTIESAYNAFYKWVIRVLGQLQPEELPQAMTSLSNPNGFHYVTKLDFTDYNTNSPYVPPVPTNSPPDPYIPYPGDDAYDPETPPGPWPPYYSPWPPYYYPPPPLTEWPQYPPPNWPYNTNSPYNPPGPDNPTPDPNNPTNYPNPDPGNTNGAGGGYTLAQWYTMLRSALSDEANSYIPSDPAQYGLTYSNDLLRAANDYTTKYFAESDKIQADADAFLVKAKGILDVVSLPLPNVGIKESFSFTFPYLNQVVEIKTSDWPIIGVFRTFMKWIMALLSFWVAFIMIKRTFGRV